MGDSQLSVTGGDVDTRTNSGGQHREVVVLGNDGDYVAGVHPLNGARVAPPDTSLYYDAFETFDTVDRWLTVGTAPTASGSSLVFSSTLSGGGSIQTRGAFIGQSSAYNVGNFGVILETTAGTGAGRFWGFGTPAGAPSATALVTNGAGFEVESATGNLVAVTYSGGTRTLVATLTRPTDGAIHRYTVMFRQSQIYWFIDAQNVHVATVSWPTLQSTDLPLLVSRYNAASLTNAPVFTLVSVGVGDSSQNTTQIIDPVLGWRRARVSSTGAMNVNLAQSASAIVTTLVPANGQFASNTAGQEVRADVSSAGNVTLSITGGTYTRLPIIFEGTLDGTNWFTIDATQMDGTGVNTALILASGTTARAWNIPVPGYNSIRVRMTDVATTWTTSPTIRVNQGAFLYEPSPTIAPVDGQKATYVSSVTALANATASDVFQFVPPGTRTARITRIEISITATAAVASVISLIKRSTTNTGGTSSILASPMPLDSLDAQASSAGMTYTAAPTALGTAVGTVRAQRVVSPATATAAPLVLTWDFGNRPSRALVMRNGERLSINSSAAMTGAVWAIMVEFTEE